MRGAAASGPYLGIVKPFHSTKLMKYQQIQAQVGITPSCTGGWITLEWAREGFGFTRSENRRGRNNSGSLDGTGPCCLHFSSSCQWPKKGLRKRWKIAVKNSMSCWRAGHSGNQNLPEMKSFMKENSCGCWSLLGDFHCWVHLNALKNPNHIQTSILRGGKKIFCCL